MAADEKTEKATPKRRKDERKKGNVFLSQDMVTVFSLLALFNGLKLLAPTIYRELKYCIELFFNYAGTLYPVSASNVNDKLAKAMLIFFQAALPLLLLSVAVAVIVTFLQTRLMVSMDALKFKMSRINPLKGFKRLFSIRSVVELLKALIKISVLGVVIYIYLKDRIVQFMRLMDGSVIGAFSFIGDTVVSLANTVGVAFLFLAAFDYLYQWWEYEKNLRMSKQEIKEEYKQTEGDPQVKGKIREKQRQMASRRMMQKVPEADVIIRNPTHFAVALSYRPEQNRAPVLLAKGADRVAFKIIEIGEANGICILENRPLARGLYENVELDMEIPEEFYQAVAEVMALVYRMRDKGKNPEQH
ncbi:flagellar biosynthesis protein FlhB [Diplocloster agilis]|uniref:Flagellar biosynthetic protein FlhB n=1 Tax=Diplocloster agilis TaxID=2850323 RepID=A0A949K354_9FIRM|nr:flagellar biosynthesis protein FlhB [Suonthocola fibrivorans]MBU9739379.1 flagellar biosynthesis protein FlhB [Diplocloster agilis]MBU9744638.1 flagellar biosynthesis protein FlhB [Diplocloster agilis]MCU6734579.1 flagellar biosynthesis protein FlhB [Suonthocola fibrivorans]SCJ45032.1 Flagellar biosynthetic protein flhB [uncultured Clostridium sp.]